MAEETISVQILAQASDNIQKLFDLITRIDERVKMIQSKQDHLDKRIDDLVQRQINTMQTVAVVEQLRDNDVSMAEKLDNIQTRLHAYDIRMAQLESDSGRSMDRWKQIGSFVIQLIWVILAAYLLTKLNLQAPAVP